MRMKSRVAIAVGFVAVLGGAAWIYKFGIFGKFRHFDFSAKNNDGLFHGVAVNKAIEARGDRYWKEAFIQVSSHPQWLLASRFRERLPGRIKNGNPGIKEIALTFDDGPHLPTVRELVAELKALDVKATFFEVGKMAEKHPELVKAEFAAGHEIANHSFSHVNLSKIPEEDVATEYRACNLLLKKITGVTPRFCRPPGGDSDSRVYRGAAANGLLTVLWTMDPKDYSNPGEQFILDKSLEKLSNGGILLLHEGVRQTMTVLPELVKQIRARGYKIVTVGQLVRDMKLEPLIAEPPAVGLSQTQAG
jgi:peptidoglycan/xylan/chitin deacetylase (PgdA/CDA1 family)